MDIVHKELEKRLVATVRLAVEKRTEIQNMLDELAQEVPEEYIAGAPFCIFQFVTSVQDGYDVEIGFPVTQEVETRTLRTRVLPPMDVLSVAHRGSPEKLGETYGKLYGYAAEHGIISDEFCLEVYSFDRKRCSVQDGMDAEVEVQFVILRWNDRLA